MDLAIILSGQTDSNSRKITLWNADGRPISFTSESVVDNCVTFSEKRYQIICQTHNFLKEGYPVL